MKSVKLYTVSRSCEFEKVHSSGIVGIDMRGELVGAKGSNSLNGLRSTTPAIIDG